MSSSNQPLDDELLELEELIFQAKDFVVPSEEMRPELMEAAKQHAKLWQIARCGGFMALGLVLLWGLGLPALRALSKYRGHITAPSSIEMEQMAQDRYADRYGNQYDEDWSLVETFSEVRELNQEPSPASGMLNGLGTGTIGLGQPAVGEVR